MRENLSKVHEIEKDFCVLLLSLPTRGGWIEIAQMRKQKRKNFVPPHTGRVD